MSLGLGFGDRVQGMKALAQVGGLSADVLNVRHVGLSQPLKQEEVIIIYNIIHLVNRSALCPSP
jgi:hypothetical protein